MPDANNRGKDRLFLATLDDLAQCVETRDEYQNLRIAGLLRLLLLDDFPLVDQVNRQRRLHLTFRVGPHYGTVAAPNFPPVLRGLKVAAVLDGFSPLPGIRRIDDVARDRFLSLIVMLVEEYPVTVRDLVRHTAYVDGVVHAGNATEAVDQALLQLRKVVMFGEGPMIYRTLRAIGRVVLTALVPLRQDIKAADA